mgnify:CR=1 FL=1|tara:strand:- start:396 stop:983 length:588 start_codon:yes stop_codon:yes gene_type:complete
MSHTNEIGLVVGKRYMITYKYEQTQEIAILKYSEFTDRNTDLYDVEYLLNTKTGKLRRNLKYETRGKFRYFKDIIDMEEIDLEYSKIKLAFAKGLVDENSLLYGLLDDLIEYIGSKFKELYFESCLKIYNRLLETELSHNQVDTSAHTAGELIANQRVQLVPDYFRGGSRKKRKSKKRKRRKSKKNKSKTRRRRR